jgi:hypothetical protein
MGMEVKNKAQNNKAYEKLHQQLAVLLSQEKTAVN